MAEYISRKGYDHMVADVDPRTWEIHRDRIYTSLVNELAKNVGRGRADNSILHVYENGHFGMLTIKVVAGP